VLCHELVIQDEALMFEGFLLEDLLMDQQAGFWLTVSDSLMISLHPGQESWFLICLFP
jgi:hypothetical protein